MDTRPGRLPTDKDSWQSASGRWNNKLNLISPRPAADEKFGSKISVSKNGNEYYMAVSSSESAGGTGKVYLYKFNGTSWEYLQEPGYSGVYDNSANYPAGSIVWAGNQLYRAVVDQPEADPIEGSPEFWELLEDLPLQNI